MNSLGRKDKEKKSSVFTKETLGVVVMLFATLCLVCLITREHVFYDFGRIINAFLLGAFGYFSFVVLACLEVLGFLLCSGKKLPFTKNFKSYLTLTVALIVLLGQIISLQVDDLSYGEYLGSCYNLASVGLKGATAGGLIAGLVAYWINALLSDVGSYVVLSVAIALAGYLLVRERMNTASQPKEEKTKKFRSSYAPPVSDDTVGVEIAGERDYPIANAVPVQPNGNGTQKLFVTNADDFGVKTKRQINKGENPPITLNKSDGGLYVGGYISPNPSYSSQRLDEVSKRVEYTKPSTVVNPATPPTQNLKTTNYGTTVSSDIPKRPVQPTIEPVKKVEESSVNTEIPMYFHDESKVQDSAVESNSTARSHAQNFSSYADIEEVDESQVVSEIPNGLPTEIFTPIEQKVEEVKVDDYQQSALDGRTERFDRLSQSEETKPSFDVPEVEINEGANERSIERPTTFTPEVRSSRETLDDSLGQTRELETSQENQIEDDEPAPSVIRDIRRQSLFGEEREEPKTAEGSCEEQSQRSNGGMGFGSARIVRSAPEIENAQEEVEAVEEPVAPQKPPREIPPINRVYYAPPLDLLEKQPVQFTEDENHNERLEIICQTLSNFNIDVQPHGHIQGPTITRYEVSMPTNVSVKKVTAYDDDLKMRLASEAGVRIQAPIPGKNLVGIEVPNVHVSPVYLRELLEQAASTKAAPYSLMFAVGKDVVGNVIMDNLAEGPHFLVGGSSGSGKSVWLNVLIVSLIMRYSPEDLRLILIDPKSVEFVPYEHLPHLMIDEIVSDPKRAGSVLSWACLEMERRYALFRQSGKGIRNLEEYNDLMASDTVPRMARIVIVVDELCDLMMHNKKEIESYILALSQKARAAGIHLVLATQRPSVDVITGTIKNNFTARVGLKLSSPQDSITIIGEGGAEKLLGKGDMLYKNSKMSDYCRYQGANLSGRELNNIVEYVIEHNKAYFEEDLKDYLDEQCKEPVEEKPAENTENKDGFSFPTRKQDNSFVYVLAHAISCGTASASAIQRRFRMGFNRAGAIMDELTANGYVSKQEGSKSRKVLLSQAEFEDMYGPIAQYLKVDKLD